MDKRLLKRHKRQVLRARERVKVSEPDMRTPEQLAAARETSRPVNRANAAHPHYAHSSVSNTAAKAEVQDT